MPFWYFASIALAAAWAVIAGSSTPRWTLITSAALLIASVVLSVTLLVPINTRVAQWSEHDVPSDWKEQVHSWDRLHYLRVVLIVTAFALLAVGCLA